MDRPSLLAAILALAALLASFPAVGSLRGLNEKGPVPPLLVDSKPSNRTAAGSAGLLASPAASNSSASPPSPPHGSELKPPPVVKNNSSASPASRSPGSPASSSPQAPPTKHQPQVLSSETPQPKKPPRAKSSPSGAGSEAPPGGRGGGGRGGKPSSKEADYECAGVHHQQCQGNVIVCFWHHENADTEERFILVQNKGSADVVVSSPFSVDITPVKIAKNASKKIKLQSDAVPTSVVLNVGGKSCSLTSSSPVNVDNFFQQLPAYATPVYGAYAVLFTALVAGVAWACCKCRMKSRTVNSGIPYQQLEMGVQESTSAVDANRGEGWYQGWENDWEDDEETGSRTKDTQHERNVSANGIPVTLSRAPARDEWEDWDD